VDTGDELLDPIVYVIARLKEHKDSRRQTASPVITRTAKYTDADGGNFDSMTSQNTDISFLDILYICL